MQALFKNASQPTEYSNNLCRINTHMGFPVNREARFFYTMSGFLKMRQLEQWRQILYNEG